MKSHLRSRPSASGRAELLAQAKSALNDLAGALRAHRKAQAAERLAAGELWRQAPNGGWGSRLRLAVR